ncbi:MAG: methionine--tRNA ligase subunit beta [Patescibacteria group bacterium]
MITFDDFQKIELRVAKVLSAERVEGSEKLIKLRVDLGEANLPIGQAGLPVGRQVVAGIGKAYEPEALVGRLIVVVANLEPRMLLGEESEGMLLAATNENGEPVILTVEKDVPPGSGIR